VSQPAGRHRRTRGWQVLRFVVGIGLGAVALWAIDGQRGELSGASHSLGHLDVGWLLAGIACEFVSFAWFGVLQRRLLGCGGVEIDVGYATALSLAAGAIADSLPAGPAFSSIYAYRQYRRRGADDALSAWTLVATLMCAALGLALLATVGVLLATRESAAYGLVGVTLSVLAVAVAADAVVWQRQWLARLMIAILRRVRRRTGWPKREAADVVTEFLARLTSVQLTRRDLLVTVLAGLGNWAFDCACLACSFYAVHAGVPWRGLLLAYGAGQLAANLPITPGGLGIVEGSLTIALVAFGGAQLSTVAAVLCYRIVSFWGYLPVGWAAWTGIALSDRKSDALARAGAAEPVAEGGDGPAADRLAAAPAGGAAAHHGDVLLPGESR
jgi:uncharacterized protein (TIRG00374 family)